MSGPRSIVDRMHELFNARRFDDLAEVLDEDVLMVIEGTTLRGLVAVRSYLAGMMAQIPMRAETERTLAETDDTLVSLEWVDTSATTTEPAPHGALPPEIETYLVVHRIAAGRIVEWRNYLEPNPVVQESGSARTRFAAIHRLMSEQAALRRVATLVAEGAGPDELFAAVAREVADVVGIPVVGVNRFEDDGTFTMMGVAGETSLAVGTRWPVEKEGLAGMILATGRPAHKDNYAGMPGPLGDAVRDDTMTATVGVPIVVDGRIWGSMVGAARPGEPIPDGSEQRLAGFTELVATAIANSQAHEHLTRLADEQAALRRVAELVACGGAQPELFDAIVSEAAELFGHETWLVRFEADDSARILAQHGAGGFRDLSGQTIPGDGVNSWASRFARPVRVDSFARLTGPGADFSRRLGITASAAAPLVVQGAPWGALGLVSRDQPLAAGIEDRLAQFADLAATAVANAESRAALSSSRARIVASADEARRRLARDVHDGAQQRLVHALITLKQARAALLHDPEGAATELLDESLAQVEAANVQLRELARGILPAALAHGGLRAAVDSLIGHIPLPVHADVLAERLPEPIETTAYFVIAEALTNVTKHASASRAEVRALITGGRLALDVCDDGRGGADSASGSGLIGIADRVDAVGGSMSLTSPPGAGTKLSVALPIERPERQ